MGNIEVWQPWQPWQPWQSLAEVNWDLNRMFEPGVMVFVFLAVGILGSVIVAISKHIRSYHIARQQNELKMRMVERGFTASEITSVLEAGPKEADDDEDQKD